MRYLALSIASRSPTHTNALGSFVYFASVLVSLLEYQAMNEPLHARQTIAASLPICKP